RHRANSGRGRHHPPDMAAGSRGRAFAGRKCAGKMSWHVFMEATGWIVWGGCGLVMLWLLIRWSADFLSLPISSRTWTTCDKTRHEANKWSEEKRADLLKKG